MSYRVPFIIFPKNGMKGVKYKKKELNENRFYNLNLLHLKIIGGKNTFN